MAPRVYAVDTKVPIVQTRNEIEKLLKDHGASRFFYGEDDKGAIVGFTILNLLVRMHLPLAPEGDRRSEQRRRSSWRALLLVIKAKLEASARGISTIEREFLADIVTPGGSTVHQWLSPQLKLGRETGEMPKALPFYGESSS
jgi:hypothetical protein